MGWGGRLAGTGPRPREVRQGGSKQRGRGEGLDATESHTRNGCDGELYLGNISRRSQLPLYRGRLCDMTRLALGSLLSIHQASFHTTEDGGSGVFSPPWALGRSLQRGDEGSETSSTLRKDTQPASTEPVPSPGASASQSKGCGPESGAATLRSRPGPF